MQAFLDVAEYLISMWRVVRYFDVNFWAAEIDLPSARAV
jgi:hypothetical protein